uniref:Uncharacterized protein n=1 Tax=Arundo donax TaxID=35708 RepID=A0A0A9HE51_ARUDO
MMLMISGILASTAGLQRRAP